MATTAVLTLQLEAKQLQRGLLKAENRMMKMEKRAGGLGTVMKTIFAAGMIRAGFSMIKMASDAEETESKLKAVFEGIEKESSIVAESIADKFGLANSTINNMLGATGDLLTGFGFTRGKALELSASVAELAIDLKSFQNFSGGAKGASDILTKALLGETESAKSLGIVIRQNTKEFKKQVKDLMLLTGATDLQAKAQIIWLQIQEQTENAQGDALKTYKSTANRIGRMGESWQETQEAMGRFLIEGLAVDDVVSGLADGMKFLTDNAHNVRKSIDAVTNSLADMVSVGITKRKGFFNDLILKYKLIFEESKITFGFSESRDGVNLIKKQIQDNERITNITLSGLKEIDKQRKLNALQSFSDSKKEREEIKITAKEAIKNAIVATEGTGKSGGASSVATSTSNNKRSSQFSGAFEKGSVEAYKIEKNKTGNRTERDNLRANRRTADAIENSTTPNLITIAG